MPAVEQETPVTVRVEVAGQPPATQTVTLRPVRKWVVYLLPHSHVDIGYTHVQTDVEQAQWKYLEMAIDTARKSADYPAGARFKWNVEVLWAVDSYLQQATPEKRQQFIDAVKAGQVGLQALYGNELTGLCRPEELLRLMTCAQRGVATVRQPITSAMITDVPGYTWGMVPAMAHSGVKYFSIGPNGGDRIGHTDRRLGRQALLVDRPQRPGQGAGLDDGHRLLPGVPIAGASCWTTWGGWPTRATPTTTCRSATAWATTAPRT